jgi:hypothetical protein
MVSVEPSPEAGVVNSDFMGVNEGNCISCYVSNLIER